MASSKEVLKDWLKEGKYVSQDVIDSLYGMKAPTDELAEQRFLEKYGNASPFTKADKITEPTIPSMANVIEIIGIEGKDAKEKADKFIEEFPKKAPEWKKKIVKNPVYGERGWQTVYEIWKQAEAQKMLRDIPKARKESIPFAVRMLSSLFTPRITEDFINTGDWTLKDALGDLGENALMAIPGAGIASVGARVAPRVLARVAPRVASKVVPYMSGPAAGKLQRFAQGAGAMSGNILGNAVAPFASEAMDAAMYDENDPGMGHRADFSVGDAAIGTAINQGVNRGLMRAAGPMIDRWVGNGMQKGGQGTVRKVLETLGLSAKKAGDDFASDVALKLNLPIVNKGELTEDAFNAARMGRAPELSASGVSDDVLKQAVLDQSIIDAINKGEIQLVSKESREAAANKVKQEAEQRAEEAADNTLDVVADQMRAYNGIGLPASNYFKYPETLPSPYIQKITPEGSEGAKFFDVVGQKDIEEALARHPNEFINYATWHGEGPAVATRGERAANIINQALPAWAVNKAGTENASDLILSQTPEIKKTLKTESRKTHTAPANRNKSSDVLKVIGENQGLTAADQKYLKAIADNPEIMTVGYKDDPTGFKLWLLERGNDLLSGTRVFRPTFGVE